MQTSDEALQQLKKGNERFVLGLKSTQATTDTSRLRQLAELGQTPFAVILSCSDSRVPSELIFDCGFGQLFIIRVAGNIVQPSQIASIEFAAKILHVPLGVVMGHSKCGAIQAAIQAELHQQPSFSPNIDALLAIIRPSVRTCLKSSPGETPEKIWDLSVRENVRTTIKEIYEKSAPLRDLAGEKKFGIIEAHFSVETGQVEFASAFSNLLA